MTKREKKALKKKERVNFRRSCKVRGERLSQQKKGERRRGPLKKSW